MADKEIDVCSSSSDPCIVKLLARVVEIETEVKVRFEEREKARILARDTLLRELELSREQASKELKLAREVHDKEMTAARDQIQYKLELGNQYQKKIDKMETTFVSKDDLITAEKNLKTLHSLDIDLINKDNEHIKKLIYIALGIAIGLQMVSGFLFIMARHLAV